MAPNQKYEEYRLLHGQDDVSTEDLSMKSEDLPKNRSSLPSDAPSTRAWKRLTIVSVAILSHIVLFCVGYKFREFSTVDGLSPYLKLGYSESDVLWWNTEYSAANASEAELNRLWDSTIPWESGIIALTNEEAAAMNLPESQPFPWDSKNKKIFIVNAHHLLHCVRNIYISIHQYRHNLTQTIAHQHILHCIDSLRIETMCTADDTPRYVPLNSAHGFRPGDGQARQCRDWSKVQEFVNAHDPCYQYLSPGDPNQSNLERFSYCKEDSQYLPKIREYFGYDEDWVPPYLEGNREMEW